MPGAARAVLVALKEALMKIDRRQWLVVSFIGCLLAVGGCGANLERAMNFASGSDVHSDAEMSTQAVAVAAAPTKKDVGWRGS